LGQTLVHLLFKSALTTNLNCYGGRFQIPTSVTDVGVNCLSVRKIHSHLRYDRFIDTVS